MPIDDVNPLHAQALRKKILKWFLLGLLVLAIGALAYRYYTTLPKKVTAFEGVSLGESKDSVFYALGPPTSVLFPPEDPTSKDFLKRMARHASPQEIRAAERQEKTFNMWAYEREKTRLDIDFDAKGQIKSIGCYFDRERKGFLEVGTCRVNGVEILDTEDEVKKVLGIPSREKIEDVTKTLSYQHLNMKLFFTQKILYMIEVGLD